MTAFDPLQSFARGGRLLRKMEIEMRYLWIVACLAQLIAGCASASTSEPQQTIRIDVSRLRALSPQWESDLIDCSDDVFQCFEAPGHFLLAFPRSCPRDNWDWMVAGHRFRNTAPAAHYGLPSGGYFSYKYPHVYLHYRADAGFQSLWVRSRPVMTENWGGSSLAEYELQYVGGTTPFRCS